MSCKHASSQTQISQIDEVVRNMHKRTQDGSILTNLTSDSESATSNCVMMCGRMWEHKK